MKTWVIGLGMFFLPFAGFSQHNISFASIDWKMQSTDAPTPDSLGRFINKSFGTNLEKVRAIYSWIATHIEYNTAVYKPWTATYVYSPDPLDTATVWPSGDEMVARKVMRKRTAVCDGYARLFKVLCNYVNVEAVIVQGFARGVGSSKFRTNHSWNAVQVDSIWQLIDVTWASGYLNHLDDYVQRQNDYYFLTPPEQFIRDHYPEELRWTLMSNPPTPSEFKKTPFRSKHFYKYGVEEYLPATGMIEAAVGDTLYFSLRLSDLEKAKRTGNDPFMDTTTYALWPLSAFLYPEKEERKKVRYSYIVVADTQWLHLLFNNDVLMRYRLNLVSKAASDVVSK